MPLGDRHPPKQQEEEHMSFSTLINCMDGRVQRSCNDWMRKHFGTRYVDTITAPGPVKQLVEGNGDSLLKCVRISVTKHGSNTIAIAAHPECAGNPVDKATQIKQLGKAEMLLRAEFPEAHIIALWVKLDGTVEPVTP
jgi:hypothetical protein